MNTHLQLGIKSVGIAEIETDTSETLPKTLPLVQGSRLTVLRLLNFSLDFVQPINHLWRKFSRGFAPKVGEPKCQLDLGNVFEVKSEPNGDMASSAATAI
jgi:hypothetical protein